MKQEWVDWNDVKKIHLKEMKGGGLCCQCFGKQLLKQHAGVDECIIFHNDMDESAFIPLLQ